MRVLGFVLLGVCALAIVAAGAVGFFAIEQGWDKQTMISATAALAILAEVCFWTGGGILGLSIIRRRREALGRFFGRLAFWRRAQ